MRDQGPLILQELATASSDLARYQRLSEGLRESPPELVAAWSRFVGAYVNAHEYSRSTVIR